jgi:hypothetical protein
MDVSPFHGYVRGDDECYDAELHRSESRSNFKNIFDNFGKNHRGVTIFQVNLVDGTSIESSESLLNCTFSQIVTLAYDFSKGKVLVLAVRSRDVTYINPSTLPRNCSSIFCLARSYADAHEVILRVRRSVAFDDIGDPAIETKHEPKAEPKAVSSPKFWGFPVPCPVAQLHMRNHEGVTRTLGKHLLLKDSLPPVKSFAILKGHICILFSISQRAVNSDAESSVTNNALILPILNLVRAIRKVSRKFSTSTQLSCHQNSLTCIHALNHL